MFVTAVDAKSTDQMPENDIRKHSSLKLILAIEIAPEDNNHVISSSSILEGKDHIHMCQETLDPSGFEPNVPI